MELALTALSRGKEGKIVRLEGGHGFQRKLRVMGIREGKLVKVLTVQPFRGPLVIEIEGRRTTLGRGMAQRIWVESDKQQ